MHLLFNSTSTNIESQDGNFRIALYNLKKLGKNDSVLPIFRFYYREAEIFIFTRHMKLFVQAPNAFSFHSIIRSEVYTITVPKSSIFDQVSLFVSHFRKQTNKQTNWPLIDRGCGRIGASTGKESTWPGFQLSFYSVSFCFIHMANFHYKKQTRAPSSFLWLLTLGDLHLRTQHQKVS